MPMPYKDLALGLLWKLFWTLPFKGTTKMAISTIIHVLSKARRYTDRAVLDSEISAIRTLPSPFVFSAAWHFGDVLGGSIGRMMCTILIVLPNLIIALLFAALYALLNLFEVFDPLLLAVRTTSVAILLVKAMGLLAGRRALPYTLSLSRVIGLLIFAGCPMLYALPLPPIVVVFFTATCYYLHKESRAVLRTWQSLSGIVAISSIGLLLYHWGTSAPLFTAEYFRESIVLSCIGLLMLIGHGVFRIAPVYLVLLSIAATYLLL